MTEQEHEFSVRAKVAAVVAESQVALTAGSEAGVRVGDTVLLHRIVEVTDPDTNEKLGSVRFVRLRLRVNHLQQRMCVAVVIDHQPSDPFNLTAVRNLKKVTTDSFEESEGTVLVSVGESATINRVQKGDEPPF